MTTDLGPPVQRDPVDEEPPGYQQAPDRTPPQDTAAEQCVLGGMMLSKDAIGDVTEILRPADFYRPAHAIIFNAVMDLFGKGEPAEPITVAAALQDSGDLARVGGLPYMHTLVSSIPTAANTAYYARIVAERAVLRRLVDAGTSIVQLGYRGGDDVDQIVDLAQQKVYDITERRAGDDMVILSDLLQPALDEIEAVGARDGLMRGVPTGFGDLDKLLNGLQPGQLIIVAGRPGLGKALALDTPLPIPDGWTTMGEVAVGDQLLDADHKPTTVLMASDVRHDRPCYVVEFSDGATIVADAEHLWEVTTHWGTARDVMTTQDMARARALALLTIDGRHIMDVSRVPSVPVKCVMVDNPRHLYLAGVTYIPTHNSTVALDFLRHGAIKHGNAGAIFSLEMSKLEIVTRLLSAEARVPLQSLRSGHLSDQNWASMARRMAEINDAPIFVDDTPNMTLMEIRAKARRLKQRQDLKLVVVDYLQLMSSPKRTESRQQEVADLSRGLKLLAKEIECPVIAVSQLNRGPEQRTDKRPQLSDLRESGSIEQDADVVILLHRDDYYDKESPRSGEADFIVAKQRNGPTDTITVAAQLHFSRFVDMAIS